MGEIVLRYLTMHISELDTPVPIVDYDIARRNIRRLQEYCDAHQFKLRPHIKTHKLPFFAHEQCKAGAVGITVQKVGEAEIMAQTGLTDILITYNVMGQEKAERLAHLTNFARISVAIDNDKALQSLVWAGSRASAPIGVLIEFESGGNRQGVQTPAQAVELAKAVLSHSGVEFTGLMTYPTTSKTAEFLRKTLPLFRKEGIEVSVVSGGGTPNAYRTHELAPVNELRVGTYIYNDRMMMAVQAASLEDCALTVLTTVVSANHDGFVTVDGGFKAFSTDRGYGPEAVGLAGAKYRWGGDEFGYLDVAPKPGLGDKLEFLPPHCDPTVNLHGRIYACRGDAVEAVWPVKSPVAPV